MQFTRTNIISESPGGKNLSSGGIILEGNQGGGGDYVHPTGWLWGNKYTGRETIEGDLTSNGTIRGLNVNATNISSVNLTSLNGNFTNVNVSNNLNVNHASIVDAIIQDLYVSGSAHFVELIIDKINSTNGTLLLSPAHATLSRVESDDTNHTVTCYFKASDGDKKISNDFDVDDLVICQSFNAVEGVSHDVDNKFIWKRCIAKGTTNDGSEHWIRFYQTSWLKSVDSGGYAIGYNNTAFHPSTNAEFEAEDAVCTLGNLSKKDRRKAMMLSATNGAWLDAYMTDMGDINATELFGGTTIREGDYVGKTIFTSPYKCDAYIPSLSVPVDNPESNWQPYYTDQMFDEGFPYNFYPDERMDSIVGKSDSEEWVHSGADIESDFRCAGSSYSVMEIKNVTGLLEQVDSKYRFKENTALIIHYNNINGGENGYNNLFRFGPYDFLAKNKYTKDEVRYVEIAVCWYGKILCNFDISHSQGDLFIFGNQVRVSNAVVNLIYEFATESFNESVRDGLSDSSSGFYIWLGEAGLDLIDISYDTDTTIQNNTHTNILATYKSNVTSLMTNGDFSNGLNNWTSNGFAIGTSLTQAGNYLYADESYKSYVGHTYSDYKDGAEHLNMAFNSDGSFLNDYYAASCAWGTEGIDKLTSETYIEQTVNLTSGLGQYILEFDALCDTYSSINGDRSFKVIIENSEDRVEKIVRPTSNNTHKYRFIIDTYYREAYYTGSQTYQDYVNYNDSEYEGDTRTLRYGYDGLSESVESHKVYMENGRYEDAGSDSDIDYSEGININGNLIQLKTGTNTKIRIELTENSQIDLFCLSNFKLTFNPSSDTYVDKVNTYKYLLVPYWARLSNSTPQWVYCFGLCKYKVLSLGNGHYGSWNEIIKFPCVVSELKRGSFYQANLGYLDYLPISEIKAPCLASFDNIDGFSLKGRQVSVISPSYNLIQASAVSGLDGAIESSSSFKVLADRIESTVTQGELSSLIRQMADSIELSVFEDMKRTGIDITSGSIVLDATRTEITGDLTLSDANQGLNIQDQGVDKIVLQNSSIGNLSDFDFGADKYFNHEDISTSTSLTFTDTLGNLSATTPLDIIYPRFQAPGADSCSYTYTLYCNGSSVTSVSGNLTSISPYGGEYMTPLSISSLSSTGTYTIEFNISNIQKTSNAFHYWLTYQVRGLASGINRIGIDGGVFAKDVDNYNWFGTDKTQFKRDGIVLSIEEDEIYRSSIRSNDSGDIRYDDSLIADISTTIPVMTVFGQSYTATAKDGLITFEYSMGPDGNQRVLTLPNPRNIAVGKWFMIKNNVNNDTLVTSPAIGSGSTNLIMPEDSITPVQNYNCGNKSMKFVNSGWYWIAFYCG